MTTAQGRTNPLSTIGAAYGKPSTTLSRTLFSNQEYNFKNPAPSGQRADPIQIELPEFKPKNECNVIKIIQKEWEREVERLNMKKYGKKPVNQNESK